MLSQTGQRKLVAVIVNVCVFLCFPLSTSPFYAVCQKQQDLFELFYPDFEIFGI